MRILNLTHSEFWFTDHFKHLLEQTGHTGETLFHSEGNFSRETADRLWLKYKDYFNQFDAILISHTASWCRVFLQNNWTKPLFVYFFFRFDHDVPDWEDYYNLLRDAKNRPNVKFFAATDYDREYAQFKLRDFPMPIIRPFLYVNNAGKQPIACQQDTFYLVGRHNESLQLEALQNAQVPIYQHPWHAGPPDLRSVRGIIHFPYVYSTRSLIENVASETVYFLPTQRFLQEIRTDNPTYFWDGGLPGESRGDFSLAEWYNDAYRGLFVYFDSLAELAGMAKPEFDSVISEKKRLIREFKKRYQEKALLQWKGLLG